MNRLSCGLTQEQLTMLGDRLEGTANSIESALECMGLDSNEFDSTDIEDALLNVNTELCTGCGWWFDSGELNDGDGCDDCCGLDRNGEAQLTT